MFTRCGRILRLTRRRSLGTRAISAVAIPAARMTARMTQTAAWWPPEPDGAWKVPAANGMAMRNSRPLTVQLAVVAMTPALTAASATYPWRWKNLTRTAKTATSPPTSAVKVFEVSSATQRPNGSWPVAAPSSAQPSATTGSWANRNVSATRPQLAPLMASRESPAPERMPMRAHRAPLRNHPPGVMTPADPW
jgi:hypothetical protein